MFYKILSIAFFAASLSCSDLNVEVGKKEKTRPEFEPTPIEEQNQGTLKSLADLKNLLDRVGTDNDDKARVIVEEIKNGLRAQLRGGIASLQKLVLEESERRSLPQSIEDRPAINAYRLNINDAITLEEENILPALQLTNFSLPFEVETEGEGYTNLFLDSTLQAVLFDFGLYAEGGFKKSVTTDETTGEVLEKLEGSINWKIVPETTDRFEIIDDEGLITNFSMSRRGNDSVTIKMSLITARDNWLLPLGELPNNYRFVTMEVSFDRSIAQPGSGEESSLAMSLMVSAGRQIAGQREKHFQRQLLLEGRSIDFDSGEASIRDQQFLDGELTNSNSLVITWNDFNSLWSQFRAKLELPELTAAN